MGIGLRNQLNSLTTIETGLQTVPWKKCTGKEITGIENNPMTLLGTSGANRYVYAKEVQLYQVQSQNWVSPTLALLITATHSSELRSPRSPGKHGPATLAFATRFHPVCLDRHKRQRCPLWGLRSLLSTFHLPYIQQHSVLPGLQILLHVFQC